MEPGSLPALCRPASRGGGKPGDPGRRSIPGAGDAGSTTHTGRQGSLAPALGTRLPAGFLSPEAGGCGARSCSLHQLGSLPGGPWGGQVDWLQADRGPSVSGGLSGGSSRWKPCLHVSAGWFPFLLVLLLPGARRPGAAGSPGLAGGPRRSWGHLSAHPGSASLRRSWLPALRAQACSGTRARVLLEEGPAPFRAAPRLVADSEPAAWPLPRNPILTHTSRLGLGCQVQPGGTEEDLGSKSAFRKVDCLPFLEGGSGARSRVKRDTP